MRAIQKTITFGLIVGTRNIFIADPAAVEHHVGMVRGHCASVLKEAISKYVKWDIYYHNGADDE